MATFDSSPLEFFFLKERMAQGRWCMLWFSDAVKGVAGVVVQSLPFRIGRGAQSDLLVEDERVEGVQCILRLGDDSLLELVATTGVVCAPVRVNGYTMHGGWCLRLSEGDLVAVPGGLEFTVRNLREGRLGRAELEEETEGRTASCPVEASMKCPICIATVFPVLLLTMLLLALCCSIFCSPQSGRDLTAVAVECRCTGARRCFRVCTACAQAARPRRWQSQTAVRAAEHPWRQPNQTSPCKG